MRTKKAGATSGNLRFTTLSMVGNCPDAWSGMVRLGAEAILGQGSGGRLKGEVEGWTWDTAVNSSVL